MLLIPEVFGKSQTLSSHSPGTLPEDEIVFSRPRYYGCGNVLEVVPRRSAGADFHIFQHGSVSGESRKNLCVNKHNESFLNFLD